MNLDSQLEGVLFYRAEPMTLRELSLITAKDEALVRDALLRLAETLEGRGVRLVQQGDFYELMTAPDLSACIESMRKEELKRDIGKAGAETLAIILYNELTTRAEIDFIRGVNSTFILRNLLIRGLIERVPNPNDQRSFAYTPTLSLYSHLGITKKEDLPQYQEIVSAIESYRREQVSENQSALREEVSEAV
jgi:segregation and condensation protein B